MIPTYASLYVVLIISLKSSSSALSPQLGPKKVTFVRHGITHMNEYLGSYKPFGAHGFSDVFYGKKLQLYRDTPLSVWGERQAKQVLARRKPSWADDTELVCLSPLTRALQTFDIGLKHHISSSVPIVAQPMAAERLYLISDVGRYRDELQEQYDYVNFDQLPDKKWWYTPHDQYQEWRPTGKGQRYACPGEPQRDFDLRMSSLYRWLGERTEGRICVVCHHGVIDWMLDVDFDNCQYMTVEYDKIAPDRLVEQLL